MSAGKLPDIVMPQQMQQFLGVCIRAGIFRQ
jgi:hypothetical protein